MTSKAEPILIDFVIVRPMSSPVSPLRMKAKNFAIGLVFLLVLSTALAGRPDPRFEGVWVGTETYQAYNSATQFGGEPVHMTAMIAIGEGGKVFGVLQGLGPGKYETSSSSDGNKLKFHSTLSGTGRSSLTFVLSADGNTITETGFGLLPATRAAVNCSISGTLHRRAKK